ncbi:MAG: glycosyltransferase family 4 protein [Alphaproteobacteria bacterium]
MAKSVGGRAPGVLQVLPALETGGVERGTVDIAEALVGAGFRALVASSGGAMTHEIARVGATHIRLPLASKNPAVMYANVARLVKVIEEEGVDIVHARSRAPAWTARAAARRTGCRFVTTFHGTYGHANAVKRRYNAVMASGETVIAISNFIGEHARRLYAIDPARLRVIRRGVDLSIFDRSKVSADRIVQLARKWRLPDGLPVVMLPGRLTRWKGQTVLIEAMGIVAARRPGGVRCLLVGADQGRAAYRAELERRVRDGGLTDVVHIVDHCNDMPAAMMLADVVVSASTDPEAFGRVAAEAQAMGRPVVATDHGGARETVIAGETGWLVAPGDAGALADAIETALDLDPAARVILAERAAAHVAANFPKTAMCARTLDVYRDLLAAGSRCGPKAA